MKRLKTWGLALLAASALMVSCSNDDDKVLVADFEMTQPAQPSDMYFVYNETKVVNFTAENVTDIHLKHVPEGWTVVCDTEAKTLTITAPATGDAGEAEQISIYSTNSEGVVIDTGITVRLEASVPAVTEGERLSDIVITPEVISPEEATFAWYLVGTETKAGESAVARKLVGEEMILHFSASEAGTYKFELDITRHGVVKTIAASASVEVEETAYKAHMTKVYEFLPAVGQFTNGLPEYTEGADAAAMALAAQEEIAKENPSMISLGGFGGYVVFGFDHQVVNVEGQCDMRIMGNAFYSGYTHPERGTKGGSCEPGIVSVSVDANHNGLPDDEWYELAGSAYNDEGTIHNYSITYNRPAEEPAGAADEYIQWSDNQDGGGWLPKNMFHNQPYYPQWITDESYTLTGTKLADTAVDESGQGTMWILYSHKWGYVDNCPNNEAASCFDISWAVDSEGNSVKLEHIDFVKVHNATHQLAGWLGETSTEVAGATDLHITGEVVTTEEAQTSYLGE